VPSDSGKGQGGGGTVRTPKAIEKRALASTPYRQSWPAGITSVLGEVLNGKEKEQKGGDQGDKSYKTNQTLKGKSRGQIEGESASIQNIECLTGQKRVLGGGGV